jgi:cation transporter-like permease
MVTWVLADEPSWEVARAIEIVEQRLGCDPDDVTWICADVPVIEPAQD